MYQYIRSVQLLKW